MKFIPIIKKLISRKKEENGELEAILKKWEKTWISTFRKQKTDRFEQLDQICIEFEKFNLERNPEVLIQKIKESWTEQNKMTLKKIKSIKNKYGSSTFGKGLWNTIIMVVILGLAIGIGSIFLTQNYTPNYNQNPQYQQ